MVDPVQRSAAGHDQAAVAPLRLLLPAAPASLGLLRAELRRWLESAGLGADELNDVLIAAHEAAANAVEHPADAREGMVEVTAWRDDVSLEILVCDSGQWRPQRHRQERGLGLSIARKLMASVDIEPSADGTSVRLRRPLAAAVWESALQAIECPPTASRRVK